MSIRGKIAIELIKLLGFKKIFELPTDELLEKAREMNAKRGFNSFKLDKRCHDELILNTYHCVRIMPKSGKSDSAVMYIFGGGNLVDCDKDDLKFAKKLADSKNIEVWLPCYPLVLDNSVMEIVRMINAVYVKMLEYYDHDKISILGFSSGGAQSLILPEYINDTKSGLPMPHQIIAVSPGSCTRTEGVYERALELEKKDVMIPASFLDIADKLMTRFGDQVPDYAVCSERGELTGVPMIHFIYGSDETLYSIAPEYEKACKKYNVPYTMTVKPGMFHCYPMLQFYPEGKEGFNEILSYL